MTEQSDSNRTHSGKQVATVLMCSFVLMIACCGGGFALDGKAVASFSGLAGVLSILGLLAFGTFVGASFYAVLKVFFEARN